MRVLTLLSCSVITACTSALIAPSLPGAAGEFADSPNGELLVKYFLSVHPIFVGIFAPIAGYLLDGGGRRTLLIPSLLLFGLSGSAAYFIEDIWLILVSRAMLGIGLSGITISVTTLIGDYFSGEKLDQWASYQASSIAMASSVLYVIGGALAQTGWRTPYLVYLVALPVAAAAWAFIDEPRAYLDHKNTIHQRSERIPRDREVFLIYGAAFVGMLSAFVFAVQYPFYLDALGYSSSEVGFSNGLMVFASFFTAMLYPRVKRLIPCGWAIYSIFMVLAGLGYVIIGLSESYTIIIIGAIIHGFGFGLFLPNINVWLNERVSTGVRGRCVSRMTAAMLIGQFLSPALAQLMLSYYSYDVLLVATGLFGMVFLLPLSALVWVYWSSSKLEAHKAAAKT